jgi:hypothetical protein
MRSAMEQYLLTVNAMGRLSDDDLLRVICNESAPNPFLDPVGCLKSVLLEFNPKKCVRPCTMGELPIIVRWMFAEVGRQMNPKVKLSYRDALGEGKKRIGMSEEKYIKLAQEWKSTEEWSVVVAKDEHDNPTGMSIAIPVCARVYGDMRDGRRSLSSVACTELCMPSSHLLIQGVAMRQPAIESSPVRPDTRLFLAVVGQHMRLTSVRGLLTKTPMKLLTFKGTPETADRLQRAGYTLVNNGQRMQGTTIELMERILESQSWTSTDVFNRIAARAWKLGQSMMGGCRDTVHGRDCLR